MLFRESETVELKRAYVDDLRKEIIAMANCAGGIVYVGVNDDGSVEGITGCDEMIQRISNGIRDSIKPDITMFIHYEVQSVDGKDIIAIAVQSGTNKPYYLAAKGLRPEGVFVRQETSSVPASDAAIRMMIRETDGDNHEDMRSMNQELTFKYVSDIFSSKNVEFGIPQMRSLGLINVDGLYTNLTLLLSDQCPYVVKAAAFGGEDHQEFLDRREFTGSLLKQLDDVYAYLELHNQTRATFEGLYRRDHKDYPSDAVREALLNAVVHREYALPAPTLVSIYSNRIELVSAGGLFHGILLDDIMGGFSICRNAKLAAVFYRLELIEAYGTGITKIQSAYRDNDEKPGFQPTPNTFRVVLPKMAPSTSIAVPHTMEDERTRKVQQFIKEHGSITRHDIENLLNVKIATAIRLLKELQEQGIITAVGKGKNIRYIASGK